MNLAHQDMDDMGAWADGHPLTRRAHLIAIDEHTALEAERKAELQADWGLAERNEGALYAPQGRPEQGWPARNAWPEMAVWAPEEEPREAMTGAEAWVLMAAYIASVLFTVWCFSMFAAYLKDWL